MCYALHRILPFFVLTGILLYGVSHFAAASPSAGSLDTHAQTYYRLARARARAGDSGNMVRVEAYAMAALEEIG